MANIVYIAFRTAFFFNEAAKLTFDAEMLGFLSLEDFKNDQF